MSKQKMLTATALAALCALAAFSMQAKAQSPEAQDSQEGMVVVRDPQTGKMRAPTADELKALRARTPSSAAAKAFTAQPQTLAGRRPGARGVRLGEKNMVYEVVTRGADGKLSSECVQGEAAAAEALKGATDKRPADADHKEHNHESR
jgi:hypothetical protein